jgi:cellulose synthase/poly-beta-1,6-N-acetylglucosamine synthase-like glycosyltransferase
MGQNDHPRPPRLPLCFCAVLAALALSLLCILSGSAWSWVVGFLYIGYDTLLLLFVSLQIFKVTRRTTAHAPVAQAGAAPISLAVLIAARNEAQVLKACIDALELQTDPPDEILWVDDGSTDETRKMLAELRSCHDRERIPAIQTLLKPHSGKADSLNQGWPQLKADVIVTLDADTRLDRQAIAEIRRAFSENARLAATGGILTPLSHERPGGLFESFQRFEYMRSFLARRAWMTQNALLLVSGAFAAYRKTVLEQVGGFDPQSLVEDYDLTHRIHRYSFDRGLGYEVHVTVGALATTDVPGTLPRFLKQRQRWFAGFLQTQFKNADMVGNARYGSVGRRMLVVKSIDTLQPAFGITALVALALFPLTGRSVPPLVWKALLAKILLDLFFHHGSLALYYRWKREKPLAKIWLLSTFSTLLEPISFQILRHTGALLGWWGFLRGKSDWAPQRRPGALEHPIHG